MTNPGSLVEERQLLVGGKWVDASGGTYEILNPATEQPSGRRPTRPRMTQMPQPQRLEMPSRDGRRRRHGNASL